MRAVKHWSTEWAAEAQHLKPPHHVAACAQSGPCIIYFMWLPATILHSLRGGQNGNAAEAQHFKFPHHMAACAKSGPCIISWCYQLLPPQGPVFRGSDATT